MIYLVYGYQKPLVDKRIKELINQDNLKVSDFDLNVYDLELTSINELLQDLNTIPLINDHKVIVGKNPFFLTTNKDIKIENNYDELTNYLNNTNEAATLILVAYEKIDLKNEHVKLIKKVGSIIEVEDFKKEDWPSVVAKLFANRQVQISRDGLNLFINKVGQDLSLAINEAEKLATFSTNITADDVKMLVSTPLENNVFALTNALVEKDYKKALKTFKDLKIQSHEPIALIAIIASQMRFMYQVLYLSLQKLSEKQIAEELSANPYRVSLTLKNVRKVDEQTLLGVNKQLAQLDLDIKSGIIDRFQGFELFVVNQLKAGNYGGR